MNRDFKLHIIQYTAIITLCCTGVLSSQTLHSFDSLQMRSTPQSAYVHTARLDTVLFVSIQSFSRMLGTGLYENETLQKLEVKFPQSTVKFTAENTFVVVTTNATRRYQVYQLTYPVILHQGIYYARASEVISMFLTATDSVLMFGKDTSRVEPPAGSAIPVVSGFTVEEKKNGSLVRIHLTGKVKDFNRTMQMGDWIYVTLPQAQCDTVAFDTTYANGIIRRIKPVQSSTSLQLSFQIRGKIEQSEIVQDHLSNDIILTLIPPGGAKDISQPVDSSAIRRRLAEQARQQVASTIAKQKKKWKLDVVVLDPGHGGHDPGAIGIIGTREKDITLGIALKLGDMIEKELPDVKVVYTRKTDRFVELYRRGQIANENEGKIFISIHCNSTERKPSSANGFEIYLLRPGKTEDAIQVAEKENAVVKLEKDYEDRYQQLTEENFIILTMAQSAYVKQSERFAEMLEETLSAQMDGKRQPVKQAGFYVLVGASMPNVLLETGYISNIKEERFLRSPAGQKKVATAILNALKGFKNEYEDENK